ncbi:zinc finger protein 280A-like [Tamandua tetradactyla]|uniref:zinc finger protein 280A-like n=1 Tax=Tamandua tetradactyla TaxID=48850 RepID=UPI004053E96D
MRDGEDSEHQDDEDAELIFIGVEHESENPEILFVKVISSAKPVISNILNRVTQGSGSTKRKGHMDQATTQALKLSNHMTPSSTAVANWTVSPPALRPTDTPMIMEHSAKPGCQRSPPQVMPLNASDLPMPWTRCVVGAAYSVRSKDESPHDSKRPSPSDVNSGNSKRPKLSDGTPRKDSLDTLSGAFITMNTGTASKGVATSVNHVQNGTLFLRACANINTHFDLATQDSTNSFEGLAKTDFSNPASHNETVDSKKRDMIMLLPDFYYGQHKGDGWPEVKTYTNFKCLSCLKVLKNVKFMKHMKHHLELEKQMGDSWEVHTTCQHCHRQFSTPFQLQYHIENVHLPQEPSPVCKICELSFETDQLLLQHMKDNHKPGEMPYVCQVCNYRSSALADVDMHFRTCHENTKNLLCPFCLKIFKASASYVNHFWRHWNKRTFQCSNCRLQFLTLKEKREHRTNNHLTFKKPEQLEGLSPETTVIIQTSVQPGSRDAAFITVGISHNNRP